MGPKRMVDWWDPRRWHQTARITFWVGEDGCEGREEWMGMMLKEADSRLSIFHAWYFVWKERLTFENFLAVFLTAGAKLKIHLVPTLESEGSWHVFEWIIKKKEWLIGVNNCFILADTVASEIKKKKNCFTLIKVSSHNQRWLRLGKTGFIKRDLGFCEISHNFYR